MMYFFHEQEDFITPAFDVILDFLQLHRRKVLNGIRTFDYAEVAVNIGVFETAKNKKN